MTQEELRTAIEARFIDQWSDNNVAFENVPYTPPDETAWVRLSVQFLTNYYNGLGECREIIGMVGVQIYSPMRQGTYRQEQMSDEATRIYQGSHDGVAYKDVSIGGTSESDGWYQSNVLINFTARGE
jgi:hypothetical protein